MGPQRKINLRRVVRRSGLHHCPDFGGARPFGLFYEADTVRFRDSSIGDCETYIEARAVWIACCGGTRVESVFTILHPG